MLTKGKIKNQKRKRVSAKEKFYFVHISGTAWHETGLNLRGSNRVLVSQHHVVLGFCMDSSIGLRAKNRKMGVE